MKFLLTLAGFDINCGKTKSRWCVLYCALLHFLSNGPQLLTDQTDTRDEIEASVNQFVANGWNQECDESTLEHVVRHMVEHHDLVLVERLDQVDLHDLKKIADDDAVFVVDPPCILQKQPEELDEEEEEGDASPQETQQDRNDSDAGVGDDDDDDDDDDERGDKNVRGEKNEREVAAAAENKGAGTVTDTASSTQREEPQATTAKRINDATELHDALEDQREEMRKMLRQMSDDQLQQAREPLPELVEEILARVNDQQVHGNAAFNAVGPLTGTASKALSEVSFTAVAHGSPSRVFPHQRQVGAAIKNRVMDAMRIHCANKTFCRVGGILIMVPNFNTLHDQTLTRVDAFLKEHCPSFSGNSNRCVVVKCNKTHSAEVDAFWERAVANENELFIVIHDEAHWSIVKAPAQGSETGVADQFLNRRFWRNQQSLPNVVRLLVSATPYALQTTRTRVPSENEIHWGEATTNEDSQGLCVCACVRVCVFA